MAEPIQASIAGALPPEPRYAEWKPVAIRRWATAWAGIFVGTVFFVAVSVLWRPSQIAFFLSALVARYVTATLVDRQLASLRDDATGAQFAVTLRLAREVTYGFDEGLLAFEDGWLVYSGRRCAFSLPASAVKPRVSDKSNLSFGFGPPGDERTAFFTSQSSEKFKRSASDWRNAERVPAEAIVLPPEVPNETAYGLQRFILSLCVVVALVLGSVLLFAHLRHLNSILTALMLAFGLPIAGIYLLESHRSLKTIEMGLPRRTAIWNRPIGRRAERPPLPQDTRTP
jgi:hypothetical protein